ncbi:cytoplasmic dynein 1 heavy chain 1-like isoform X2 [Xenia sp. Carnegie-2017]|nr:cytoplasmic dynein 1 heavy chain 1-like isoform X2 [Xenia sp. Carnegie-2017]
MAITPRHYLDFINHYVKLYNEKRSDLEEQQLHLNVGLTKIKETVEQVEELQKSLSMKSQELKAKNALANQKLKQMLKDQQEAEKKRVTSTELQAAIAQQTVKIKEKKALVMDDLAQVEPAVQDAKQAVKSNKKQHLVEVRSMANPPQAVKVALESICLLLGEQAADWRAIRSIIMRDNFIPTIVTFQTENISEEVRAQMLNKYMSQPDYNFDKVNRASQACGPLVKWAIAQVKYADMLLKIEPLRHELKSLETEASAAEAKAAEIAKVITGLEKSIAQYKEEYAALISEAQAIKTEMTAVESKVNRSVALLRSLSDERSRWQDTSNAFQAQMGTIVGDVMLSSAFLAYAGYFDQQLRQNLFTTWSHHLQQAGLEFRHDLARTEMGFVEKCSFGSTMLVTLENKLHTLNPHANFRLFLTMEINPKVPVNLLRASRVFVFEPPPGIRANLFRTFSTIPVSRMCKAPTERTRLYFLLAWLHAIVQERLRYAPLGWSKHYEFSESDLRVACETIDTWLDISSQGRTNISPDKVPWDALRTLLTQAIYGGRIDNEFDQRLLSSFVNRLFTVSSFESDFPLVLDADGVKGKNVNMPDGIRREQFVQWTEKLPDSQSPSWLGLPNNAEKLLLTVQGQALTTKLLKMQNIDDEEELAYSPGLDKNQSLISNDTRPAWMRSLHSTATNWLAMVPEELVALKRTNENIKDPLFRFFEREVNVGIGLLKTVRGDLQNVIGFCEQVKKPTNYLRNVISDLMKAILPKNWRRYTVLSGLTVIQWIGDFSDRIQQLQQISTVSHSGSNKGLKNLRVHLGWLFVPEAYITATRQYVAQANNWSLEELSLKMTISRGKNEEIELDDCSFGITGLKLQGEKCVNNRLELATVITTDLPLTSLSWIRFSDDDKLSKQAKVTLPVYLNQNRRELLFTVVMEFVEQGGDHRFYERGVAFLASSMTG